MRFSGRRKFLPLTAVLLLMSGCASSPPELPPAVGEEGTDTAIDDAPLPAGVISLAEPESVELEGQAVTVLHKANYNPLDLDNGKSFKALRTAVVYASELERHSIESAKEVDFETSQVLVSSSGKKPTGGYGVSVIEVSELEDIVVVTVVQTIPGPSCITIQGITHPFEFVLIPSRKPIEIYERQKVENC